MEDRTAWVYGLYDIENPSRVRYVGQTISRKGVPERVYYHKWAALKGLLRVPSSFWIRKIGPDRVGFLILEETRVTEVDDAEKFWISEFRSRGMADLNISDGGTGTTPGHFSGDLNPRASLTWEIVKELRARAVNEYVSASELASQYGMTSASLSKILRNHTWYDPSYNPELRLQIRDTNRSGTKKDLVWRTIPDSEVEGMRREYLSGISVAQIVEKTGHPPTSVRRCLFEKYGSEETRQACLEKKPHRPINSPRLTLDEKRAVVARYYAGESQGALSREIGVSQTAISLWVRNDRLK